MRRFRILLSTLVGLTLLPAGIFSETFRVGAGGEESPFPVYMLNDDNGRTFTGVTYDFLKEIAKKTGDKLDFVTLPSARVVRGISDGTVDIDAFASPLWRTPYATDSIYTIPYLRTQDYFIFKKGKEFPIHSLSDLKGKTVEVILGFGYEGLDQAFGANSVHRSNSKTASILLKKLENDRADVAILNGVVFDYLKKKLHYTDLMRAGPFGPSVPISFRFNKKNAAAVQRFNEAIQELVKDGTLKRIALKYSLDLE